MNGNLVSWIAVSMKTTANPASCSFMIVPACRIEVHMNKSNKLYVGMPSKSWLKKQSPRKLKKFRCSQWQEFCVSGELLLNSIDFNGIDTFVDRLLDQIESQGMQTCLGYKDGDESIKFHLSGAGVSRRHSRPLTDEMIEQLKLWIKSQPEVRDCSFGQMRDAWWGWD